MLEDGNERIIAIRIACVRQRDLVIICAYMPCRGPRSAEEEFGENLDILYEIKQKYNTTCDIVVCADINSNIVIPKDCRDTQCRDFVTRNGMHIPEGSHAPTFFHHNGKDSNVLDYILSSSKDRMSNYCTLDRDSRCSSSHVPVLAEISLTIEAARTLSNRKQKSTRRTILLWDKCDKEKLNNILSSTLEAKLHQSASVSQATPGDVDSQVQILTTSLIEAAKTAVPSTTIKPGRAKPWSEDIKKAQKCSRAAHTKWKVAGRPGLNHHTSATRRAARKALRKAFRIQTAKIRDNLLEKLMSTHANKDKLFYKLIAKQRSSDTGRSTALTVDGRLITDPEELCEAWASYFKELGTPTSDPEYNDKFKERVEHDLSAIHRLFEGRQPRIQPVTEEETRRAIRKLNRRKAADPSGLRAEHLTESLETVASYLARLYTSMLELNHIPEILKTGTMVPIPKKGKDPLLQNNYRGITLTSIIVKVLEHILLGRDEDTVLKQQNRLQIGFTRGTSPAWGSLMFTETLSEAKDCKLPTFAAALDVKKAFDTVWHPTLLRKLFLCGIEDHWLIRDLMVRNLHIQVRVDDKLSSPVHLQQGVGQGRPWSTTDYKLMVNELLNTITGSSLGSKIGPFSLAAPTCADDMLLLSHDPDDLQGLLDIVLAYSHDQRYTLHPTKSMVLVYDQKRTKTAGPWSLGSTIVPVEPLCRHLGIDRFSEDSSNSNLITNCISTARRASYALMGAGFHGNNGNSPVVIRQMYLLYIIPRCTYGLECMVLKKSHLAALERYHRKTLKQLMSLPERTATEAVHLIIGIPPITAFIHMKSLSLLGAIARSPGSILHDVGQRQLSVKDLNSASWFVYMITVTELYGLPSPHELFAHPRSKKQWKTEVKKAVYKHYSDEMSDTAREKSSLSNLCIQDLSLHKPSPLVTTVSVSLTDVQRARVQLRMATGTYTLQNDRARFNKNPTDPTCQLCYTEREDLAHFLTRCPALTEARSRFYEEAECRPPPDRDKDSTLTYAGNPNRFSLTRFICDPAWFRHDPYQSLRGDTKEIYDYYYFTRKFVHILHSERNTILEKQSLN